MSPSKMGFTAMADCGGRVFDIKEQTTALEYRSVVLVIRYGIRYAGISVNSEILPAWKEL